MANEKLLFIYLVLVKEFGLWELSRGALLISNMIQKNVKNNETNFVVFVIVLLLLCCCFCDDADNDDDGDDDDDDDDDVYDITLYRGIKPQTQCYSRDKVYILFKTLRPRGLHLG